MIQFLAGVIMAAAVFGGLLFSLFRAVATKNTKARLAHIAVILSLIAAMIVLTNLWDRAAPIAGGALVIASLAAMWFDRGITRVFLLFTAAFGVAIALGLPF